METYQREQLMTLLLAHDSKQHLHGGPFFTEADGAGGCEPGFNCPIDSYEVVSHEIKSFPKDGMYPAMDWMIVRLRLVFDKPYWIVTSTSEPETEATFELFVPASFAHPDNIV